MFISSELEQAVRDTAEGIADIYVAIYPEEEEEAEDGITEYFEYYSVRLKVINHHTCLNVHKGRVWAVYRPYKGQS